MQKIDNQKIPQLISDRLIERKQSKVPLPELSAKPISRTDTVSLSIRAEEVLRGGKKPDAVATLTPTVATPQPTSTRREVVDSQAIDRLFTQIQDVMGRIRDLAQKASDPTLTGAQRADYTNQFNELLNVEFRQLPYNLQGIPAKAQEAIGRFVNPEAWVIDRGTTNIGFANPDDAARIASNIDNRLNNLETLGRFLVSAQLNYAGFVAGKVEPTAVTPPPTSTTPMITSALHTPWRLDVGAETKPADKPVTNVAPAVESTPVKPTTTRATVDSNVVNKIFADIRATMNQLRELAEKAKDTKLSAEDRSAVNAEFERLIKQFNTTVERVAGDLPADAQTAIKRFVNLDSWALDRNAKGLNLASAQNATTIANNINTRLGNLNLGLTLVGSYLGYAGYRIDGAVNDAADA